MLMVVDQMMISQIPSHPTRGSLDVLVVFPIFAFTKHGISTTVSGV
jgi:hypothetical protein